MRHFILSWILLISISTYGQANKPFNRMDTLDLDHKAFTELGVDSIQAYGFVVIKVTVNRDGDVISADPLPDKSTTKDPVLLQSAKDAALKAKFNKNPNAAPRQIGFIRYRFKVIKN